MSAPIFWFQMLPSAVEAFLRNPDAYRDDVDPAAAVARLQSYLFTIVDAGRLLPASRNPNPLPTGVTALPPYETMAFIADASAASGMDLERPADPNRAARTKHLLEALVDAGMLSAPVGSEGIAVPPVAGCIAYRNHQGALKYADGFTYFPPGSATPYAIGTGDGVAASFQLRNADGPVTAFPLAAKVYRTDWQGRVRLRPEPRKNYVLQSFRLNSSPWTKAATGTGTEPTVTEQHSIGPNDYNFFGGELVATQNYACRVQLSKGDGTSFLVQHNLGLPAGKGTFSFWARKTNTGVGPDVGMRFCIGDGTPAAQGITVTLRGRQISQEPPPVWQRFEFTADAAANDSIWIGLDANTDATADVLIAFVQAEEGEEVGAHIATTSWAFEWRDFNPYFGTVNRTYPACAVVSGDRLFVGGGYYDHAEGYGRDFQEIGTSFLVDFRSRRITNVGNLVGMRSDPCTTVLADGRVFIAGGSDIVPGGVSTNVLTCEIFDPVTGLCTATGQRNLLCWRGNRGNIRLLDGRVLLVGGLNASAEPSADAEVYDPVTGLLTTLPDMAVSRFYPSVALLNDGRVLIAGGYSGAAFDQTLVCEIFDPATNTFAATGSLSVPQFGAGLGVLADGRAILAGGTDASFAASDVIQTFDPDTGGWSTPVATLSAATGDCFCVPLRDGRLLFTSRAAGEFWCDIFDPSQGESGGIVATGAKASPHYNYAELSDGRVVGFQDLQASILEFWDPATDEWSSMDGRGVITTAHPPDPGAEMGWTWLGDAHEGLNLAGPLRLDHPLYLHPVLLADLDYNDFDGYAIVFVTDVMDVGESSPNASGTVAIKKPAAAWVRLADNGPLTNP